MIGDREHERFPVRSRRYARQKERMAGETGATHHTYELPVRTSKTRRAPAWRGRKHDEAHESTEADPTGERERATGRPNSAR
eukprot:scaffold5520_cov102-Isochrysis_galbana.AAC.6